MGMHHVTDMMHSSHIWECLECHVREWVIRRFNVSWECGNTYVHIFAHVTCLIRRFDIPHSNRWHASFAHVTGPIHILHAKTDPIACYDWSCVWYESSIHDSFTHVTCLIRRFDMSWECWQHVCARTKIGNTYVHVRRCRDLFAPFTWLFHTRDMSRLHTWHVSFTNVTWLILMRQASATCSRCW